MIYLFVVLQNEDNHDSYDDSSSDDEHTWTQEVKKQHKLIRKENREREREEKRLKFYEIKEGQSFKSLEDKNKKKELKYDFHSIFFSPSDSDLLVFDFKQINYLIILCNHITLLVSLLGTQYTIIAVI